MESFLGGRDGICANCGVEGVKLLVFTSDTVVTEIYTFSIIEYLIY